MKSFYLLIILALISSSCQSPEYNSHDRWNHYNRQSNHKIEAFEDPNNDKCEDDGSNLFNFSWSSD